LQSLAVAFTLVIAGAMASVSAWATPEEGLQLRSFVAQIAQISGDPQNVQAQELRGLMAHNPELMTWLLDDRDTNELVRDADLESLFSVSGGAAHPSGWLRRLWQGNGLPDVEEIPILTEMRALALVTINHRGYLQFQNMSINERLAILERIGDQPYLAAIQQVNARLTSAKVSESAAIQTLMGPENMGDFGGMPPDQAEQMRKFITKYFDALSVTDKRKILIAYLKLPPHSPIEKQIGVILQNCGPVMQKLFQQIGDDSESPLIQKSVGELKANVKPSGVDPTGTIERETGQRVDEIFSHLERTPFKAGTVGESFRGTLRDGTPVIVKVLRPGILEAAQREFATMRTVAGNDPLLQGLVNNLEVKFMEEIDLRKEAANILEGLHYKNAARGISSVELAGDVAPTQNVLILKVAEGKTLDQEGLAGPALDRGQALANAFEGWFDRAIFGDGRFHADPHGGNFLFKSLPGKKPPFKLTYIDFGSFGRLTPAERRAFVQFAVAAMSKSPEETVSAIAAMANVRMDAEQQASLIAKYRQLYAGDIVLKDRTAEALFFGISRGIPVSPTMMQFSRGWSMFENNLKNVNAELDVADPQGKLPRFDSGKILGKVAARRIGLDVGRQMLHPFTRPLAAANVDDAQFLPLSYWSGILKQNRGKILQAIQQSCNEIVRARLGGLLGNP
jgi:predicted unusual protein kinase regulating ubiquinone biosynthesis (AarF/ABC1/UbiB family)